MTHQRATEYGDEPIHVHDLPQLYTHPSTEELLTTLRSLALRPSSFSQNSFEPRSVSSTGLATYLTLIISSPLSWIDEPVREEIWELASARLSERSGRAAAPAMTRQFVIDNGLTITLHEPSLTEDNLGLKTWSSSFMLAKRLQDLRRLLPHPIPTEKQKVLELGAGTGLIGIAAACKWSSQKHPAQVTLTDLPEIVPNLQRNAGMNEDVIESHHGSVSVSALDWADENNVPHSEEAKFSIIVAADPLYSPEHPKLLVGAVGRWLRKVQEARFVVAVPLREGYSSERMHMRLCLKDLGLHIEEEGEDSGYDDWELSDGQRQEVTYSWSVWKGSSEWFSSEEVVKVTGQP